jgi:hypothetical protein
MGLQLPCGGEKTSARRPGLVTCDSREGNRDGVAGSSPTVEEELDGIDSFREVVPLLLGEGQ